MVLLFCTYKGSQFRTSYIITYNKIGKKACSQKKTVSLQRTPVLEKAAFTEIAAGAIARDVMRGEMITILKK
jgi:hypothetical protein